MNTEKCKFAKKCQPNFIKRLFGIRSPSKCFICPNRIETAFDYFIKGFEEGIKSALRKDQ